MNTAVKNFYPEYPEVDYQKTSVAMTDVEDYLKTLPYSKFVKIAAYVIFRNESGNGKSGVNNNYCGIQADNARWPDYLNGHIIGTVVQHENMTGAERRFIAFDSFKGSVDFLADRILKRGLYETGKCIVVVNMTINDEWDWVSAYWKSWVTGDKNAVIPTDEKQGLLSMYKQATTIF